MRKGPFTRILEKAMKMLLFGENKIPGEKGEKAMKSYCVVFGSLISLLLFNFIGEVQNCSVGFTSCPSVHPG